MLHLRNSTHTLALSCALLGLFLLASPVVAETSYSFPRVLEGPATLLTVEGDREEVVEHQPILVGDRLWVPDGSRLEIVLADRSLLRVEGESEISFERIAYSADREDMDTRLRILRGDVQLVVPRDALGERLPRIDTEEATLHIHREGTFRISALDRFTELVVRDGLAEMVTDHGSVLVHEGEAGWAEGFRNHLDIRRAGYRDGLERWGDRLSDEARLADVPYVDESLRYHATPLARHGLWVSVGGRHAWRPRIEVSWRPYSRGYWRHTPAGLTWVSYDPWGYVTHHYGDWDYDRHYGWVWYPGRVYSPARVHWYWGPSYVGWCPTGYYSNYYRNRHSGFSLSFGIYGYAGGDWGHFAHWSFSTTVNFGRRHKRHDHHDYIRSGRHLARHHGKLERGIISNDYRVKRDRADEIYAGLRRRMEERKDRVDVTDFVARRPLAENVTRTVLSHGDVRPGAVGSKPTKPTRTNADARPGRVRTDGKPNPDKPARLGDHRGTLGSADVRRPTRPTARDDASVRPEDHRGSLGTVNRPTNRTPTRRPGAIGRDRYEGGVVDRTPRPPRATNDRTPSLPGRLATKPGEDRSRNDDATVGRGRTERPSARTPTTNRGRYGDSTGSRGSVDRGTVNRGTADRGRTTRPSSRGTSNSGTVDRGRTTRPTNRGTSSGATVDRGRTTRPTARKPEVDRSRSRDTTVDRSRTTRPSSRATTPRPSSRSTSSRATSSRSSSRPSSRATTPRNTPAPRADRSRGSSSSRSKAERPRSSRSDRSSSRATSNRSKENHSKARAEKKGNRRPAAKKDRRDDNR